VVEPLLMLVFAYFSYVIGELFHLSGIISLICCGLAQAQFARLNISRKSFITVRYITKTLSALADNVIFIFLGMLLVQPNHLFNAGQLNSNCV
jgi:NhaP-type Na+/H+ or K+/H+ antiporter